ncbi:tRNA 5-methylaminomethyl-2-thiouridine biosynthesis bifunctional protein MnmC [bioreactor metagenome]|uniref:tRNA 5-methylaminomethyl-2-thiouridine biosynthesis bifunctional protein MnmC n=1 Tax=bioreactor metagenome TaxID=1076179 RepID=A0A645DBK0_9ZZZZ|nr:tRNA (5-methylaminomethyl-2-thiouridine)(34)-methyltransferase MnmD [Rikenellaceae bacterium]
MNDSREIILSADGSSTLKLNEFDECFHSINGALSESLHIYINSGLEYYIENRGELLIFEMGFGTGLNAFLTLLFAKLHPWVKINYLTIEKFPLKEVEYESLNYPEKVAVLPAYTCLEDIPEGYFADRFNALHKASWGLRQDLLPNFSLTKSQGDLLGLDLDDGKVDIIYYDAFSPNIQPELWGENVFEKLYRWLVPGGILVTYSSKGVVKQALRDSGFLVRRLPGPAGKKHIVRAIRP